MPQSLALLYTRSKRVRVAMACASNCSALAGRTKPNVHKRCRRNMSSVDNGGSLSYAAVRNDNGITCRSISDQL